MSWVCVVTMVQAKHCFQPCGLPVPSSAASSDYTYRSVGSGRRTHALCNHIESSCPQVPHAILRTSFSKEHHWVVALNVESIDVVERSTVGPMS
jgi:hypothetical protein